MLFIFFISNGLFAHEIQSTTQYVALRKTNQVGLIQDFAGKLNINSLLDLGLLAGYSERYNFYDKRLGALVAYRPSEKLTLEAHYLQGMGNIILPEKQVRFDSYYALSDGLSPFLFYRDTRYTRTITHTATMGLELEKVFNLILIPSFMLGKATFKSPAMTENLYNYGLKIIYYIENRYSISSWVYKGREASQGIIGQSTLLVDTFSGGLGGGYYFTPNFKTEILFDHTNYDQLKTEFHTTTLNLQWMY